MQLLFYNYYFILIIYIYLKKLTEYKLYESISEQYETKESM